MDVYLSLMLYRYTLYYYLHIHHRFTQAFDNVPRARCEYNRKKDFGLQPMNYYAVIINVIIYILF